MSYKKILRLCVGFSVLLILVFAGSFRSESRLHRSASPVVSAGISPAQTSGSAAKSDPGCDPRPRTNQYSDPGQDSLAHSRFLTPQTSQHDSSVSTLGTPSALRTPSALGIPSRSDRVPRPNQRRWARPGGSQLAQTDPDRSSPSDCGTARLFRRVLL
jgi:hypothetical protein